MPPLCVASRGPPDVTALGIVNLLRLVPRGVVEGRSPVAALMASFPVGASDNLCNEATAERPRLRNRKWKCGRCASASAADFED
jgi:hypothetical protein